MSNRSLARSDWRTILPVYTGSEFTKEDNAKAAMLGSYEVESDLIRFTPRFPFVPGLVYLARLHVAELGQSENTVFGKTPKYLDFPFVSPRSNTRSATFVEQVYPSADQLPENLLKFYIHFSAPIGFDNVHDHIRLLDKNGMPVPLPFVEIDQGLWGPRRQRLTLFLHPGRIKRNVGLNLAMGPVLREGENYQLVVDRGLRDASGNPLVQDIVKHFAVLPAVRQEIVCSEWRLEPPLAGTRQPLKVDFEESLDHALLLRYLLVCDETGTPVPGEVKIINWETRFLLKPDNVWNPGNYSVVVNSRLEDLAGNRVGKVFDAETIEDIKKREGRSEVEIKFKVHPHRENRASLNP